MPSPIEEFGLKVSQISALFAGCHIPKGIDEELEKTLLTDPAILRGMERPRSRGSLHIRLPYIGYPR
jgi:hypothetical protein